MVAAVCPPSAAGSALPKSTRSRRTSHSRPGGSPMQTVKRAARFLHPLGAAGVVALVFLQVYLIAAYIFGDSGVLNSHVTVGRIVVALELLVFVTALVGWWDDQYGAARCRNVPGLVREGHRVVVRGACTPWAAGAGGVRPRLVDARPNARRSADSRCRMTRPQAARSECV